MRVIEGQKVMFALDESCSWPRFDVQGADRTLTDESH
jgi:hypothetical protein